MIVRLCDVNSDKRHGLRSQGNTGQVHMYLYQVAGETVSTNDGCCWPTVLAGAVRGAVLGGFMRPLHGYSWPEHAESEPGSCRHLARTLPYVSAVGF